MRQQTLFTVPVDETRLRDDHRTIMEAIDRLGGVSAEQAGKIYYRLRGWRTPPIEWVPIVGLRLLRRLRGLGLVCCRRRDGLWVRRQQGRSRA